MRSYIQSGGVSRNGSYFDVGDFSLYVKEYVKYSPLTERDLEAMPYIYLFQLAQSSYGYKEYLVTKTENKEALLDLGFCGLIFAERYTKKHLIYQRHYYKENANMEIWDAYDAKLNKIDETSLIRGEEIPDGMFHLCCEIIVRHKDGTYLLIVVRHIK
ncbi:hypothetical protein [Butyrivibrio sp. WCD2001]|uniref:hypothetical protein n=1 Tax=Butyrivibrio sp. WCD2001 TaxID=1280681 RepID=UPI000406BD12|nr:hypothetical protein [Butyrivibrio sp. WCD2001]